MPAMAEFDVAILGDGPAACTVARCLAFHGHRVCLLRPIPRQTAGSHERWETLSPGAIELMRLHHPDVWPRIASLLIPCSAEVLWTRCDERSERGAVRQGTLVDRRLLDSILFTSTATARISSRVIDPTLPLPSIASDSGAWLLSSGRSGAPDIRCRFLVDAAGRTSALGGTRFNLRPRTLALTAHVTDTRLEPRSTCVEALADGWLWAGRGDEADTSITLFISPRTVRSWPRGAHSARFLETLRKSSLAATGSVPRMVSKLLARDATAVERTPITVDGLLRTGDAALAFDPLSGQGFQHALVSAAQAAIVLHTMIAREESYALAQEFYCTRHAEAAHEHALGCIGFYRRQDRFNGEFWRERMGEESRPSPSETPSGSLEIRLGDRLILSDKVSWREVPVIADEFVRNQCALCHPSLTRPIAFLEGQATLDLLAGFEEISGLALLQRWTDRWGLSSEAGLRALRFLVRQDILMPMGAGSCRKSVAALVASHN